MIFLYVFVFGLWEPIFSDQLSFRITDEDYRQISLTLIFGKVGLRERYRSVIACFRMINKLWKTAKNRKKRLNELKSSQFPVKTLHF